MNWSQELILKDLGELHVLVFYLSSCSIKAKFIYCTWNFITSFSRALKLICIRSNGECVHLFSNLHMFLLGKCHTFFC